MSKNVRVNKQVIQRYGKTFSMMGGALRHILDIKKLVLLKLESLSKPILLPSVTPSLSGHLQHLLLVMVAGALDPLPPDYEAG